MQLLKDINGVARPGMEFTELFWVLDCVMLYSQTQRTCGGYSYAFGSELQVGRVCGCIIIKTIRLISPAPELPFGVWCLVPTYVWGNGSEIVLIKPPE